MLGALGQCLVGLSGNPGLTGAISLLILFPHMLKIIKISFVSTCLCCVAPFLQCQKERKKTLKH